MSPLLLAQAAGPGSASGARPEAGILTPVAAPSAAAPVTSPPESLRGDTRRTRFVIGLDKSTQFQVFSLSGPNRVIVELQDVQMRLPTMGDGPVGLVQSFRGGLSAPGRNRVVIDVTAPVIVENARIEKSRDGRGQQLALEIVPVDGDGRQPPRARKPMLASASGLGAVGLQPPVPRPALSPKEKAARTFKHTIVIDPGHGGHDSGAQKFGTVEKDVVLAFSLALREKLRATGRYNVLMTRDTDTFVDLDERREFGERNKAGLFLSVHADYASTSASGATIFSLRDSVSESLKRSAKGEVASSVLSPKELTALRQTEDDVDTVRGILADLAQREVEVTKDRTSTFSRAVIEKMSGATTLRDNPDRSAAFRVLLSAQVPSVLIELAFVSNQQDAKNLRSEQWRSRVADSIVTAIDNYFSHQISRLPM